MTAVNYINCTKYLINAKGCVGTAFARFRDNLKDKASDDGGYSYSCSLTAVNY